MDQRDDRQIPFAIIYGVPGVFLLVVAGHFLSNADQDPAFFLTLGLGALGGSIYLILVGAVARGIELMRR